MSIKKVDGECSMLQQLYCLLMRTCVWRFRATFPLSRVRCDEHTIEQLPAPLGKHQQLRTCPCPSPHPSVNTTLCMSPSLQMHGKDHSILRPTMHLNWWEHADKAWHYMHAYRACSSYTHRASMAWTVCQCKPTCPGCKEF